MSGATRRDVIKLAAAGITVAVGPAACTAQVKDKEKEQEANTKKAAESYLYPGAKAVDTTTRSMATVYTTKLTSKDDAKKVYQWYRKKLDVSDFISEGLLSGDKHVHAITEYTQAARAFQPARPLDLYVIASKVVGEHVVTIVVSRAKDEEVTHISLTLLPEVKK